MLSTSEVVTRLKDKEVDCTRIAVHSEFKDLERSLGAVYYNFPHAGLVLVTCIESTC